MVLNLCLYVVWFSNTISISWNCINMAHNSLKECQWYAVLYISHILQIVHLNWQDDEGITRMHPALNWRVTTLNINLFNMWPEQIWDKEWLESAWMYTPINSGKRQEICKTGDAHHPVCVLGFGSRFSSALAWVKTGVSNRTVTTKKKIMERHLRILGGSGHSSAEGDASRILGPSSPSC